MSTLLKSKLRLRKTTLLAADIILVNAALYLALIICFNARVPQYYSEIFVNFGILMSFVQIGIFYLFGLYRSLWEYASIEELLQIVAATLVSQGVTSFTAYIAGSHFPLNVYFIAWLLTCMATGGIRLSYRYVRRISKSTFEQKLFSVFGVRHIKALKPVSGYTKTRRVMIFGAGCAGSMIIKELKDNAEINMVPVIVVDDNKAKHGTRLNGVRVKSGRANIREYVERYMVDDIIVAIPSAQKRDMSEILRLCKETKCKIKTLPEMSNLINGKSGVKQLREIKIEDLLGRDEVKLDMKEIAAYLKNEIVLVTGGGGSIGSELCRQIARFGPKKLIIFDIYENSAYDLQNELLHTFSDKLDLEVLIGSCRDRLRLKEVFERYRPGVVFHAAAHKHVPLMEGSPAEAVKNNVFGTLNTARRADDYGAKKFILVSTDKAVNPTNIMGASKRLAEIIVQSMNRMSKTKFAAVRFGNVLGSNGSVIPLFSKQILQGGPVTVTHPEINRYFMTIPEASQLVMQAGALAEGGEVFVLDMGEPVKIDDLARDMIRLSGLEPDSDIKIEYTGLRPGEKLYEELLMAEEGLVKTKHDKIFIGKQSDMSFKEVIMYIKALENTVEDDDLVKECMAKLVPTYRYIPPQIHDEIDEEIHVTLKTEKQNSNVQTAANNKVIMMATK